MSTEMSTNVSVLRDFLLFRGSPDLCSHLFNTDDISVLFCVWLRVYALADFLMWSFGLSFSLFLMFFVLCAWSNNNNNLHVAEYLSLSPAMTRLLSFTIILNRPGIQIWLQGRFLHLHFGPVGSQGSSKRGQSPEKNCGSYVQICSFCKIKTSYNH